MGRDHHPSTRSVTAAVVTVSDTRTEDNDDSGKLLRERLDGAGHRVASYRILPDEPEEIRRHVTRLLDERTAQAVITTGGTGISARDSTYEALVGLLEKRLDGFGELFRFLSWEQVGAGAMLSRAIAGAARGGVVIALPGSRAAVELAVDKLVLPQLAHMVKLAERAPADTPPPGPSPAGPSAPPGDSLRARLARLAADTHAIAAVAPARPVEASVLSLYNTLRGELGRRVGESALAGVPRFGSGAAPCYGELAVLCGQLAGVQATAH